MLNTLFYTNKRNSAQNGQFLSNSNAPARFQPATLCGSHCLYRSLPWRPTSFPGPTVSNETTSGTQCEKSNSFLFTVFITTRDSHLISLQRFSKHYLIVVILFGVTKHANNQRFTTYRLTDTIQTNNYNRQQLLYFGTTLAAYSFFI